MKMQSTSLKDSEFKESKSKASKQVVIPMQQRRLQIHEAGPAYTKSAFAEKYCLIISACV